MRVLHVIPTLEPSTGGPVFNLASLAPELSAAGVRVSVLTTHGPEPPTPERGDIEERLRGGGVEVLSYPTRWPHGYCRSPALKSALRAICDTFDVAHLHSVWLHPTLVTARRAARVGVPYIVRPAGALDPYCMAQSRVRKRLYAGMFEGRTLRRASGLHFTSAEEAAASQRMGSEATAWIVPIGLAVDPDEPLRPFPDPPRAVFVGRVAPIKNVDALLRAWRLVVDEIPSARLDVIGPISDSMRRELGALAQKLGLNRQARILGPFAHPEVLAHVRTANVLCLPSKHENFGLAAAEALGGATPVVLSRGVQIADDVAAAGAGTVCDASPGSISRALLPYLRSPRTFRAASAAAHRLATDRWSWDAVVPLYLEMYAATVEAAGSRPDARH